MDLNKKAERIAEAERIASRMRVNSLKMGLLAGPNGVHLGACLSIVEIMAVLYGGVLNIKTDDPQWKGRDRFILSKGHGSMTFYAALEACGIITEEKLFTYSQNGGELSCTSHLIPELGMEFANGTLGFGLSYGAGLALASGRTKNPYQVYVLLGDGECNEGSVSEAAMSAHHYKLSNLTAIVDLNSMQSDGNTGDVLAMDFEKFWTGFGWEVIPVEDGHNILQLIDAFDRPRTEGKPRVIIARTIKGKGISFMEHNNEWHHAVLSKEIYDQAMNELNQSGIRA